MVPGDTEADVTGSVVCGRGFAPTKSCALRIEKEVILWILAALIMIPVMQPSRETYAATSIPNTVAKIAKSSRCRTLM